MKPRIYKGKVIVHIKSEFYGQLLEFYIVKNHVENKTALHHGTFDTLQQAKDWIDNCLPKVKS